MQRCSWTKQDLFFWPTLLTKTVMINISSLNQGIPYFLTLNRYYCLQTSILKSLPIKKKRKCNLFTHGAPTAPTLLPNIGNYFVQKVNDVYDHLKQSNATITVNPEVEGADNITPILHFKELTVGEVMAIFNKTTKTWCPLDPLPTSLVLQCLDNLSPIITTMLNLSLQTGHFSDSWKRGCCHSAAEKVRTRVCT